MSTVRTAKVTVIVENELGKRTIEIPEAGAIFNIDVKWKDCQFFMHPKADGASVRTAQPLTMETLSFTFTNINQAEDGSYYKDKVEMF